MLTINSQVWGTKHELDLYVSQQEEVRHRRMARECRERAALLPGAVLPEHLLSASYQQDGIQHDLFSHLGQVRQL